MSTTMPKWTYDPKLGRVIVLEEGPNYRLFDVIARDVAPEHGPAIAAAPDLLAALIELHGEAYEVPGATLRRAEAAIAKATNGDQTR